MSWLVSLFGSRSGSSKRSKALSSTRDAFSMPSPFEPHTDAYSTDTPDPESSTSYTYPPQANGSSYGYVPTSASSRSRPASLLPIHNTPRSPMLPYPSLEQTWTRLRTWLSNEYPELGDTLNYGILPQDLAQIEMQFGFALPQAVRESYLIVDGQEPESSTGCSEGLFFGLYLLPLEEVYEEWRLWREVDSDSVTGGRLRNSMQSIPSGWVRKEYSNRGWIPLVSDKAGNYIGIDVNPDEGGSIGQVIVFGREFDTKVVLHRGEGPGGWARWLASFVEELESGEGFEIGPSNDSEGSEDDIGYESYFGNGTAGVDGNGEGISGLRFTGEYRGWPALEAWADKSVRKWIEAGLVPEYSPTSDKGKAPEKVGLGVLDLAKPADDASAEVAIPVFSEGELQQLQPVSETTAASKNDPNPRAALPTISVTKPPAPRPVLLPTENDMLSPTSYDNPSPADIESGFAMPRYDPPTSTTPSLLTQPSLTNATGLTGTSPTSPVPRSGVTSGPPASSTAPSPPVASTMAPLADVADLLVDSSSAPDEVPTGDTAAPDLLSDGPSAEDDLTSTVTSVSGDETSGSVADADEVTSETSKRESAEGKEADTSSPPS